ncbi:hypothetical protein ABW20_dc0109345 [Dactylellina cionopaga]|nr:hypothetical protein ABW20_dc0109345 [Dactylellina cionopaga]
MAGDLRVRWIFLISSFGFCLIVFNIVILTGADIKGKITEIVFAAPRKPFPYFGAQDTSANDTDRHPIATFTHDQIKKFEDHKAGQSKSFSQAVQKYRAKYDRHPPPKFDEWYKFAKTRDCVNIDDFDQIMDDLRPFWGIPPAEIRAMVKAMDSDESKVSILRVRSNKVVKTLRPDAWRADVFVKMLTVIAPYLPDLDIAMNFLDEPRVVAPWEEVQAKLLIEERDRSQPSEALNEFSKMDWDAGKLISPRTDDRKVVTVIKVPEKRQMDLGFFSHAGKPYMDLAAKACPPESPARRPEIDTKQVEDMYRDPVSGFIRNFNLSSNLCIVGPSLSHLHGFLFSSSSVIATQKLVPIFNECKVNVNNDILFPANKYYDEKDARYAYDDAADISWDSKQAQLVWRGVTSGGTQTPETYQGLHRHRFVTLTNSTKLGNETQAAIMAVVDDSSTDRNYTQVHFHPSYYADVTTDVGFSEIVWCVPDCHFLDDKFVAKPGLAFKDTWKFKYLADIDGHSFSGRWYAFLKSKCVGIKATIFREWHDQRLFEWAHFAPMDNRFNDLYALLTYFTGLEKSMEGSDGAYVPSHDAQAKGIADRSREWATKVLRKEDIEIYMLRLMLEYARVVDDNRDKIGYSGDGTEVDAKLPI